MRYLDPNLLLSFGLYFVVALGLWLVALRLYIAITPYRELDLVKDGNVAAAWSVCGAGVGLALPLASLVAHSASVGDMALWAVIALVAQLGLWAVLRLLVIRTLSAEIVAGKVSVGVMLGGLSACTGLLNAACVTY